MEANKNLMLVMIVIVLFALSGIVLYQGIFAAKQPSLKEVVEGQSGKRAIVDLLPYGKELQFDDVKTWTQGGFAVAYESVVADQVGVGQRALISPVVDDLVPSQVQGQTAGRPVQ